MYNTEWFGEIIRQLKHDATKVAKFGCNNTDLDQENGKYINLDFKLELYIVQEREPEIN